MQKEMLVFVSALLLLGAAAAYGAGKEEFVKKATEAGDFEIMSSELAEDKTKSAEVKKFAQMMIKDHTEAAQKLEAASGKAGLAPEEKGVGQKSKHAADMEKLQKAEDADFDALYISVQRTAHEEAVKLFSDYAENGDDPTLKQFAADTLPTLRMHLDHAKALKSK